MSACMLTRPSSPSAASASTPRFHSLRSTPWLSSNSIARSSELGSPAGGGRRRYSCSAFCGGLLRGGSVCEN